MQDSEVKLLRDLVNSPHCRLEILRIDLTGPTQQGEAEHIRISSDCHQSLGPSNSALCETQGFTTQPECASCCSKYKATYVSVTVDQDRVTLTAQDQELKVWTNPGQKQTGPRRGALQSNVPAEERLRSVRTNFINRVSEPVLHQLLDELFERVIITDHEMQSVRTKVGTEKARDLIDMVRRKGNISSSALITALCKLDPCVSKELELC
ncbi:uncharacterized protein LOC118337516 [Morone saxatilis]|uniref:uncharacterized protein LOC118337516 n=1 Tax=Morone saxatilis TaxID=34816 RepID=UPI0015E1D7A4|nr:uncharacterized protein LOC118337516 [Morone saxatilis]